MAVYRIVGGDLAHADNGGNAFRISQIERNEGIIAQEYEPLPWVVYKLTQAKAHKTVMNIFKNRMQNYQKKKGLGEQDMTRNIIIGVS